jgi:anti-sigma regulatory factor (Ser/Thr protein kinase)
VASLGLPPDHTAPSRARHFVAETLRAWRLDAMVPDAELLVSELVTNAVLHAHSAAVVSLDRAGSQVRVSVSDDSSALPKLRDYGPAAVTGRGIMLVDRVASRWGVDLDGSGKSVWFELGVPKNSITA